MKRLLRWGINIVATLVGAYILVGLYDSLPMNMPDFMDDGIRAILHLTGNDHLANPDDMENIALLVVLVASILFAGIVVLLVNIWIRRRAERRPSR
ncbi:MAG TPA: hypothetical protein VMA74_11710 [Dyella sp.]|uniref:hypothetical protein n=1 Tax=Dyella sp. TaxID=1869338 RepID=UPI002CAC0C58|nr:hypothetical protein [Dyella sp.]HUB90380.1 hypothetical protein [Dyella sp.]